MDFSEAFKRYLHFEASFLLSCFFHLLLAFGRSFHLSSCSEINLSLDVFLTTEEDLGLPPARFAKGQDSEGRGGKRLEQEQQGEKVQEVQLAGIGGGLEVSCRLPLRSYGHQRSAGTCSSPGTPIPARVQSSLSPQSRSRAGEAYVDSKIGATP